MPLDTTIGGANADSYASLAYALAYHADKGNAAWALATDGNRETAMRRATTWLDGTYRGNWTGYRVNGRLQALDWPRSDVADIGGYAVDYLTIPPEVLRATCEAALRELALPGGLSPDVTDAGIVKSESVGPISVTYRGGGGVGASRPIVTVIDDILSGLLSIRRGTATLVRA